MTIEQTTKDRIRSWHLYSFALPLFGVFLTLLLLFILVLGTSGEQGIGVGIIFVYIISYFLPLFGIVGLVTGVIGLYKCHRKRFVSYCGVILNLALILFCIKYYPFGPLGFIEVKWPLWGSLIILGGYLLLSTSRKKSSNFEETVLICPKCVDPISKKAIRDSLCPICGTQLENCDDFYESHPELRSKP